MRAARLLGLVALTLSAPAQAGEAPVEIHGFLLGALSMHTSGGGAERAGDYVLGEERLRLELGASSGGARFFARGDVFYDAVDRVLGGDLREAYLSYTGGPVDIKAGRQIVTWGAGDVLVVNDYFPKDWESFFGGRPAEYLKLGADALSARVSGGTTAVDLVVVPFFTPDRLPSASRFGLMDPYAGAELRDSSKATFNDIELAARVSFQVGGFDLRLYGYRGRWREPSVRPPPQAGPAVAERFYPALSALGASAQRPLLGGVVAVEAAYYDSRQDPRGDDPVIPNSRIRLLLSYQAQPWTEVTVGVQAYAELIESYRDYQASLPPGQTEAERARTVVSVRLSKLLRYQTLKLSLFAAAGPTEGDFFLQPEISYKLTDSLTATLGANVFGGPRPVGFGAFKPADNVYASARFDF